MVNVEKTVYNGWNDCIRLTNGKIEAIVTTEVGPRVIRYGFVGKENELCERPEHVGIKEADEWAMIGGHRLWHSPEDEVRTYHIDLDPVDFEIIDSGVILNQITEPNTGIKKSIKIVMNENGGLNLTHYIKNENLWAVELALWAITVMAPGGLEIMKQPDRETGLLSNRTITLWPYSKMNDNRVTWGGKLMMLQQDCNCDGPFKLGFPNEYGWSSYFNHGNLFIKKHNHDMAETYPDFNCSYETYTCEFMTEMESLSPLYKIEPGMTCEHSESWELYADVSAPSSEDEAEKILSEYVK